MSSYWFESIVLSDLVLLDMCIFHFQYSPCVSLGKNVPLGKDTGECNREKTIEGSLQWCKVRRDSSSNHAELLQRFPGCRDAGCAGVGASWLLSVHSWVRRL